MRGEDAKPPTVEAAFPPSEPKPPRPRQRSNSSLAALGTRWDEWLFLVFLALLAWVPFWFGSNSPVAWGANAVGFGALALLYELGLLATRRRHPLAARRVWFPVLAFLVVCFWSLLQLAPFLPVGYQHPIWQMAREALGREMQGAISVNRDDTAIALTRFGACGLCFWLAAQFCRSSARARKLTLALAAIGVAYALYGILAFYLFPGTMLWFDKRYYLDSVTSTFVNRNTYATYAGIGLMTALALAANLFLDRGASRGANFARKLAQFVASLVGAGGLALASLFFLGAALILTGSRGGFFATLAGVLTFLLLAAVRGRKNAVAAGFGGLAVGLAIAAAFFNFGDLLADRLSSQGLASDDRLAVYGLTWSSIADAPLFGFGDGTFQRAFYMYRDASISPFGVWDKAHNSYLELLQGLGVPVATVLLLSLAWAFSRCVHAAVTRRRSAAAPLAASAATVVVGLHAFVDFSLQIEAVALTFAALLGAGVAQSWSSSVSTER